MQFRRRYFCSKLPSASSWGCELKHWKDNKSNSGLGCQPPREAVSWNIDWIKTDFVNWCQPPREAVSWNNSRMAQPITPILSASSWGCELKHLVIMLRPQTLPRQPPREAVSWNITTGTVFLSAIVSLLVRLWVETKSVWFPVHNSFVSLLVRLWVETLQSLSLCCRSVVSLLVRLWVETSVCFASNKTIVESASSWGCELKRSTLKPSKWTIMSASSWGCELKRESRSGVYRFWRVSLLVRLWVETSQPKQLFCRQSVSLLVRLWVETCQKGISGLTPEGQPPREAVSWNARILVTAPSPPCQPPREAVSWNSLLLLSLPLLLCQPPREAVSWNS